MYSYIFSRRNDRKRDPVPIVDVLEHLGMMYAPAIKSLASNKFRIKWEDDSILVTGNKLDEYVLRFVSKCGYEINPNSSS